MLSVSGSTAASIPVEPLDRLPASATDASLQTQRAPVAEGVQRMLRAVPTGGGSPAGERTLVASEDSATAGGVHDAYDLRLYQEPGGSYTLELDMKVELNFQEGPDGQTWTALDKQQFIDDYKGAVEDTWSGRALTTDDGQAVTLDVNLDAGEAPGGLFGGIADMMDGSEHWNIDVVRIDEGGFNQSYVVPSQNTGRFDSEDVQPIAKGATDPQVGAAHEFGHMIGLPDEYNGNGGADAADDTDSVMHTGMEVRQRHLDIVESWIEGNT